MPRVRTNPSEPAHSVIEALGGTSAVAKHLGLTRAAVSLWSAPRGRSKGGYIPMVHWGKLRTLARKRGVELDVMLMQITIEKKYLVLAKAAPKK